MKVIQRQAPGLRFMDCYTESPFQGTGPKTGSGVWVYFSSEAWSTWTKEFTQMTVNLYGWKGHLT